MDDVTGANTGSPSREEFKVSKQDYAVVNFQQTLTRLAGNRQLLRELIEFFQEDAPLLLTEIAQGLTDGDVDQVRRASHSLKGLASNFDAEGVVAAARRLELGARERDLRNADGWLVELRVEVERLTAAFETFV